MATLKVFGTRPKDSIFIPQVPFSVRNDCQVGQWKVGDEDFKGNTIEISIIKVAQFFGTLGKTKNTQWMQVWFVPAPECKNLPQNTVCFTYIKSRSISQFSQKVTELMESGEPAEGIFIGSFEKHSNERGIYYSVKWDWRKRQSEAEKSQLTKLEAFMQTDPPLIDLSANLLPLDGLPPSEVELLIRSARAQQLEEESKKIAGLPPSR